MPREGSEAGPDNALVEVDLATSVDVDTVSERPGRRGVGHPDHRVAPSSEVHSEASSAHALAGDSRAGQQRPADRVETVDQQRARERRIRVAVPRMVAARARRPLVDSGSGRLDMDPPPEFGRVDGSRPRPGVSRPGGAVLIDAVLLDGDHSVCVCGWCATRRERASG